MNVPDSITDNMVLEIFEWYRSAMGRVGRRVDWPKCHDIRKTYFYRSLHKYADKCYNDLGLDNRMTRILTYDVVEYAAKNKLLNKGALILQMDLVGLCYNSIKNLIEEEDSLIVELQRCKTFLDEQISDKNNHVQLMIEPMSDGGLPRIVYWYQLGYLTSTYIALSKSCLKAVSLLKDVDDFPKQIELFKISSQILATDLVDRISAVIGSDLRSLPLAITK